MLLVWVVFYATTLVQKRQGWLVEMQIGTKRVLNIASSHFHDRKMQLSCKTSKICLRQQNPKKESCNEGGAEVI
ncbi:hypothetical protein SLEP1_g16911 [Rubroshorea leprosula]|uniref:Uncharacterized protein n=1 Tax=Rubroshorea leprosula TaxID=152421 RepID=A0AAV5IY10_9ROSI|nr:hypothetical protein SLEP1_g16911 [Rubroshorea leprosula]